MRARAKSGAGVQGSAKEPTVPDHASQPLLSILVPAYRYADGVARILAGLAPWPSEACEVLVFDDSPDDAVADVVRNFNACGGCRADYRHNTPALGAVPNWNALIAAARGRHVWLLHHDEFPIGKYFVDRLLARLGATDAADVLLLDCLLADAASGRNRRHLPAAMRLALARHAPCYLYRRNVIGPASALIVRRAHYPVFEPQLRWLVDVDAYAQLLQVRGIRVDLAVDLQVGSVLARQDSITATLQPGLARLEQAERRWLRQQRSAATPWLQSSRQSASTRLMLFGEGLLWALWRLGSRCPWWLGFSALPREHVRQALLRGRST